MKRMLRALLFCPWAVMAQPKAVVFIDIPTDCVQHKLLIYFFCGTIVKTSEFFVFLDIPKVPFRLD